MIDKGLYLRVLAVFSISVITSLASVVHVVVSMTVAGLPSLVCSVLEVSKVIIDIAA